MPNLSARDCRLLPRALFARERERHRAHQEQRHDQVVVGTAQPIDDPQRVDADHDQRELRVEPTHARTAPRQRERAGARQQRLQLHPPQRPDDPQGRQRIGQQRVQRPVGGRHLDPVFAHVAVDRIGRDRGRAVQIGVDGVYDAHARVGDVAEHVRGDQDRADEHDQLQGDRQRDRPARGDAPRQQQDAERTRRCRTAARSKRRDSRDARRCRRARRRCPGTWGSAANGRRRRRERSRAWRQAARA